MIVAGISVDPESKSPVLMLRVKDQSRVLPIWIGPTEAGSISVAVSRMPMPRPLTHDLLLTMLHSLNVALTAARITAVREGTFYAEIDLQTQGVPLTIDCRPSDAVALALRAEAPIYASDEVLDSAGKDMPDELSVVGGQPLMDDPLSGPEGGLEGEALPGAGEGSGKQKTIILSDSEAEDFLSKLLHNLEPESKYKM